MSDLINKYPYTDFHAVNLDYILKLVRENAGLHLEESGNQILLKTADNTIVSAITAPYAASAGTANTASSASYASTAGSASSAGYATNAGTAATATNATNATKAASADYATTAGSATSADSATYASTAASATNATNAVIAQTALYANTTGNVEHADNAIETVSIQGDKVRFTTYGGTVTDITIPFATKAQKDDLGNIIKSTYVADVVDNNGQLNFKDAEGNTIKALTPSVTQAVTDSYGNTIADYVKSVSVDSGSDYVTIDHGTGTAETLQIPYSDKAWKDTNGNVIKNTYVKRLEIITDENDGQKKLVAYNGDNPEAELFRFPVEAYRAQIAAEADHASSADYATEAGTAQTALTSTGSISSITTPANESDSFTISNGDGTTKKINIHNKSIIQIDIYGDGIKTNPTDLAVNASEDYEVDPDDLSKYSNISEVSDFIKPNITFEYTEQSGGLVLFNATSQQVTVSGNTAIVLYVFNGTSIVVLQIEESNTDGYVTITRLM